MTSKEKLKVVEKAPEEPPQLTPGKDAKGGGKLSRAARGAVREIFINQHLQTICVWKVLVPFILIILMLPIYILVGKVSHPFEKAFAHGDLLIFSSLILIEAAVELKRTKLGYDELLRAGALFTIFLFGFIKLQAMKQEPLLEKESVDAITQLWYFSFFNCAVSVCAVIISIYTFLKAIKNENDKREQTLESGPTS
jgi:hypothetical protein